VGFWSQKNDDRALEQRLRDERPQASDDLIDRISGTLTRRGRGRRRNGILATAFSTAVLVVIAGTVGISAAANRVTDIVSPGGGGDAPNQVLAAVYSCTITLAPDSQTVNNDDNNTSADYTFTVSPGTAADYTITASASGPSTLGVSVTGTTVHVTVQKKDSNGTYTISVSATNNTNQATCGDSATLTVT
jgi:hypothetical protein